MDGLRKDFRSNNDLQLAGSGSTGSHSHVFLSFILTFCIAGGVEGNDNPQNTSCGPQIALHCNTNSFYILGIESYAALWGKSCAGYLWTSFLGFFVRG